MISASLVFLSFRNKKGLEVMSRKINCGDCGKHLGEIRDARLATGIKYTCRECFVASKSDNILDFAGKFSKYKNEYKR
jgi:hypothetical protein